MIENEEMEDGNTTHDKSTPATTPELSGKRALAVSFQKHSLDLMKQLLSELGFGRVEGTDSVSEALSSLRNEPADLLLADLEAKRLEEMDLIRNSLALDASLPIIVASGHAVIEWSVELMKAGVRDVIRKPIDVPVFKEKILNILFVGDDDPGGIPDQIGTYRVIREIERGGMGIIYEALNSENDETVALKVLPTSAESSMNQILRFRKEADAISRMDHPYIVQLKGNGFSGKRYYIAMEYIDGQALDILAYERNLHFKRLVPIMAKILEALDYAHEINILHRDLKPSNVIVDREDVPHIIDFGLAQYLKGDVRLTKTGVVMGTIGYIAPERIRGKPATPLSDIYSAGAMLYECLTRKIPYETESRVITIPTSYDQLVPLRRIIPDLPSQLEAICFRALAINPRQRYKTMGQFKTDLDHFMEGF
ncbi:MAG: serine/threonine-protein kinase [Planctomycetota bacterium]|jgi:CheY-like chemotaxis protein